MIHFLRHLLSWKRAWSLNCHHYCCCLSLWTSCCLDWAVTFLACWKYWVFAAKSVSGNVPQYFQTPWLRSLASLPPGNSLVGYQVEPHRLPHRVQAVETRVSTCLPGTSPASSTLWVRSTTSHSHFKDKIKTWWALKPEVCPSVRYCLSMACCHFPNKQWK